MNIQKTIRDLYRKAGQISNILMDPNLTIDKAQELRQIKDGCFKKIDFYKNLYKNLNRKVGA